MKQKPYIYIFFVIIVVSTLSFNACKKEVYNKVSIASDSSITIFNATPGSLENTLTASEKASTSKLTISGTIDARDFQTMHIKMRKLATIDISNVKIVAYSGKILYWNNEITYISSPEDKIPNEAFENNSNIQSILLPLSLKAIGEGSFVDCKSLKTIIIPPTDTIIEAVAFNGCTNILSITIPTSVKTILGAAFGNCTSLTTITIPSSVTIMGYGVFVYCTNLVSINLSASMMNIPSETFLGCNNITTIKIPSNVTAIGGSAFSCCTHL